MIHGICTDTAQTYHGHCTDCYTYARTLHGPDRMCTDVARICTDVHGRTDAARTLHGHFMVPFWQDTPAGMIHAECNYTLVVDPSRNDRACPCGTLTA